MKNFYSAVLFVVYGLFAPNVQCLADVSLDGTLGPAKNLTGPHYAIEAADGKLVGNVNLFHSFDSFSIASGESATFNGPDSVSRIIGRVTGGNISSIDGLIRSTIPAADLFLLNPSGFMFGPNATLDISGSFHVSTADYLRFGEQGVFAADPTQSATLVVAPVSSFGFLVDEPKAITIRNSTLVLPKEKTLSLVAGAIKISSDDASTNAYLSSSGGQANLISTSSSGEATLADTGPIPDIDVSDFSSLGTIALQNAYVDAGGDGGGTVIIRGGRLYMEGSAVYASAKGPVGSKGPGAGVDIQVSGDVVLNDSAIGANVFHGVSSDSGGVRITADRLELNNDAWLQSVAYGAWAGNPASFGNSGDIELNTNYLLLDNTSQVYARTGGAGDAGAVIINTADLEMRNASSISTTAFAGTGNAGDIEVRADKILFSNSEQYLQPVGLFAKTYWPGTGKAGDISVKANELTMLFGTEITNTTGYVGQGGNIHLDIAGDVYVEGTRSLSSAGGYINTGIFNNTFWSADGGTCTVNAGHLTMTNEAGIQVAALSSGNAGNATIIAKTLELTDGGHIAASSIGYYGSGGNGGLVEVVADEITIAGPPNSTDPFGVDATGIATFSRAQGGAGGDVKITTGSLLLTNRGGINSASWSQNPSGDITIKAEKIDVRNGAYMNTGAFGTGAGGSIALDTGSLTVSGVHPEPFTDHAIGLVSLARSTIASQAMQNGGDGGRIDINTSTLRLQNGGLLATDTYGHGDAGNIEVAADTLLISGVNPELRDYLERTGGDPKEAGAAISSSSFNLLLGEQSTGDGGIIRITADQLRLQNGGHLSSSSNTAGAGGEIIVATENVKLLNQAFISAESKGSGNAGDITVTAADMISLHDAAITTEASVDADGGNITLNAPRRITLTNSKVTSSVGGGPQTTGGNISIDPQFVILQNGQIVANAYAGTGGNIGIVADTFLADPQSVVDASSTLGVSGTVDIQAPINNVSGILKPLSAEFVSAAALLKERCMARIRGNKYSSLVVGGRDGMPLEPGNLLPGVF